MRWLKLLLAWLGHLLVPPAQNPAAAPPQPTAADADSVAAPTKHPLPAPPLPAPLDRYEADIRAYEAQDALHPVAPGGTVFAGSSTFTLWTELEAIFRHFQALNRGFGGSTIPEITHYAPRVVLKYRPRRVVFYAGTNDIADGASGRQVYERFLEFLRSVRSALPHCEVFFISCSIAPCRIPLASHYDEANRLIRAHAETSQQFTYIDVVPVMRDADGRLKHEYFLEDELHMNQLGYAAWTPVVRRALGAAS